MSETQTADTDRGTRKVREGVVVSDKMDKTLVVQIERLVKHPVYKRYVRQRRKFHVHYDAEGLGHKPDEACRAGDTIRFMETRRLSKLKRWRFVDFVDRAK
jgi:small subunit ribosomal protein S17